MEFTNVKTLLELPKGEYEKVVVNVFTNGDKVRKLNVRKWYIPKDADKDAGGMDGKGYFPTREGVTLTLADLVLLEGVIAEAKALISAGATKAKVKEAVKPKRVLAKRGVHRR